MRIQTIQDLAVLLSEGGIANYVIMKVKRSYEGDTTTFDLPEGVEALIDGEAQAIEYESGDDDAREAYISIREELGKYAGLVEGSIVLIEDGMIEQTTIC